MSGENSRDDNSEQFDLDSIFVVSIFIFMSKSVYSKGWILVHCRSLHVRLRLRRLFRFIDGIAIAIDKTMES